MKNSIRLFVLLYWLSAGDALAQSLESYSFDYELDPIVSVVPTRVSFNGYTNYWHDVYNRWYRYGNLFKISIPDVVSTIIQSKLDVAEDLLLSGLMMQEGFLNGILTTEWSFLDQPSVDLLTSTLQRANVLVAIQPDSDTGRLLLDKAIGFGVPYTSLQSHQYGATDMVEVRAFFLSDGSRTIYVIASSSEDALDRLRNLLELTKEQLEKYDLHRGWFGAKSLTNSVTSMFGHPLETIGRGMNEGNTWFTFSGYMDFLLQKNLIDWLSRLGNPVVVDVGINQLFGCSDYEGLQIQDMGTREAWIDYAREKNGYIFQPVYDPGGDSLQYDGFMATEGDKVQVDSEGVPFVVETGSLEGGAESSMVLFIGKGRRLTKDLLWESILDRRSVAVLAGGKMMGPASYRNVLQMLYLDRVYLEEYFGDRIDLLAEIRDYTLSVTITNTYDRPVSGSIDITLPPELDIKRSVPADITIPGRSTKSILLEMRPPSEAMGRVNPIGVAFKWEEKTKRTMAVMDLPRAISAHQLLYGHAPTVSYPLTIHNFTEQASFPVHIQVYDSEKPDEVVYETTRVCSTPTGSFEDLSFDLNVPPGRYNVRASALGEDNVSQLGVGEPAGSVYVFEDDLNGDGIAEYRMENDSVRVTLLATGARVIEYIVKSRDDNVLFKLWPDRPIDHRRPHRLRGFYPYGGFEDFLGQASIETHKVYDAEILRDKGDYVSVLMTADYFGNRLEKTYTLYGDSPLLECRFALTFVNPESNVLGPQPILELGKEHWTEDVFVVPAQDGLTEFRMRPEDYYGQIIHLKEGWNAGYDTKEDVSFIGAFPVTEPLFLHMWMNHPRNSDSHYYYAEFQPWVPIYQKSTMYFTYYLWGAGGAWENSVRELRERNLITSR